MQVRQVVFLGGYQSPTSYRHGRSGVGGDRLPKVFEFRASMLTAFVLIVLKFQLHWKLLSMLSNLDYSRQNILNFAAVIFAIQFLRNKFRKLVR